QIFRGDLRVRQAAPRRAVLDRRADPRLVSQVTRLIMIRWIVLAAALLLGAADAHAWPDRPIVIGTGFPTGAGTDIFARLLGEPLSQALGQNIIVDNRTGAGGNVGSEYVAHAKPDGHTFLLGTAGTHAINVTLYPKLPFDVEKDFAPITLLADV